MAYRGATAGKNITVAAALHQLPLFIRGGSIVPTRERHRRSSTLMKMDPFTLRVALSTQGSARGELYMDDGETYSHLEGDIVWREFAAATKGKVVRITSTDLAARNPKEAVDGASLTVFDPDNAFAKSVAVVRIEKMVLVGVGSKPKSVTLEGAHALAWEYTEGAASSSKKDGAPGVLVIKDPRVVVTEGWAIVVQF